MPSVSITDIRALSEFGGKLSRSRERSLALADEGSARGRQAVDQIRNRVEHWQHRCSELRNRVASIEADLRACEQRDASCGAIARALAEARNQLARAEDALKLAQRARSQAEAAFDRLQHSTQQFKNSLVGRVHEATADLAVLTGRATDYTSARDSGASTGSVSTLLTPVGGTPLMSVPVSRIDLTDSSVIGPSSYQKVAYDEMRRGMNQLDEVVLPAVRQGADGDYFTRLDESRSLDYEHGYRQVYDSFFGDSGILLDARPDGSYGVINGYHRIHLAQELNWLTIPARVR